MKITVKKNINEPFMSVERSGKPLCLFLLLLFILNTVFLPNDTFHLKAVSLIVLLLVGVRCWFVVDCEKPILIYSLAVTSLTILLSIVETGDIAGNIRGGYMGFILLLFPIIKYYRIDFEKLLMNVIIMLGWLLLLFAVLIFLEKIVVGEDEFLRWLDSTENVKLGSVLFSTDKKYLFYKTSPMLCIAMPYCFRKKRFVSFAVLFVSMFLSGTRANQIIAIITVVLTIMFISERTVTRVMGMLFGMLAIAIILYDGRVMEYFRVHFVTKAGNDVVRGQSLKEILENWSENPLSLISGTGYTSTIFDPTRKQFMPILEISYWNLLRQIGLIPFLMMMGMFLFPVAKLGLENREWAYVAAYVGYLAICYNDPLLYSTTGMTVLLFMYYLCYSPLFRKKKEPGETVAAE